MARTGIRASAVIFKDDKLVLIHRHNHGREYWVLPGGGVETGETAEQAVVREVKEETNLDVTNCKLAFYVSSYNKTANKHPVFVCQTEGDLGLFSGPELDSDASSQNQYVAELVSKSNIPALTIFPEKVKPELLKML
ncbi:MAG: NUDIX domain-containing protein [bacterium]|nr:NUDIX domain-containing protein [bacterium]